MSTLLVSMITRFHVLSSPWNCIFTFGPFWFLLSCQIRVCNLIMCKLIIVISLWICSRGRRQKKRLYKNTKAWGLFHQVISNWSQIKWDGNKVRLFCLCYLCIYIYVFVLESISKKIPYISYILNCVITISYR